MKVLYVMSIVIMVMLMSCKKDNNSNNNYIPDCSGGTQSYAADVKPVFSSNCNNCHSDYSDYNNVYNSRSSIRSTIIDGSMPKGKTLSSDQKNAVVCWIDNGAANN